jgi:hypothetical protein
MLKKHVHFLSVVMGLDGQTIRFDPFTGLWQTKLDPSFDILDNNGLDRFDKSFLSINTMAHKTITQHLGGSSTPIAILGSFEKQSSLGLFSLATCEPICIAPVLKYTASHTIPFRHYLYLPVGPASM